MVSSFLSAAWELNDLANKTQTSCMCNQYKCYSEYWGCRNLEPRHVNVCWTQNVGQQWLQRAGGSLGLINGFQPSSWTQESERLTRVREKPWVFLDMSWVQHIPLVKGRRKGVWKRKQHKQELIDQMICNEITRSGSSTPQKCLLGNKQRIFLGVGTVFWKWL